MKKAEIENILKTGKTLRISGRGYSPAIFWMAGGVIMCNSPSLMGPVEHPKIKTAADLQRHINKMIMDGLKITIQEAPVL